VDDKSIKDDARLVLTFIDRKEKRRLIDKEAFIEKLRSKFPDVEIDSVDYASLSFAEQLNATRRSDILIGVHGAGLTHGMFMRPGSAMVEILPQDFNHKGFRNLAKIMGHQYFSSHAVKALGGSGDWQIEDVILEEDRFMGLLDVAVKSMYNRGTLDKDVTK
jgi:protein O-GlcNAc transferase